MIEIKGQYNTAICYTPALEKAAEDQIRAVCDQKEFSDSKIRIMPDVHAGIGCTIGTTMTITDKIVPGMVGVDIGCGMETLRIAEKELDYEKLDEIIRTQIPCGREIRTEPHELNHEIDLNALRCAKYVNLERARCSIGTLGSGNHFIEVDRGEEGDIFLVIHSGSRHLGTQVAKFYQEEGRKALWGGANHQIQAAVAELKAQGRFQEIEATIKALKRERPTRVPRDLAWVEGKLFDDYLHDMAITQHFAALNRKAMVDVIVKGMGLTPVEQFTTIHNYIDTEQFILRKGAVSARKGEKLLIPINMRDGSLICVGKGNPEWNYSAPHGAGRLMSRKAAFENLSLQEYEEEMSGIYSTCVNFDTLDESPMAYKGIDEIIAQIGPTVDILEQIRPLYNFKASE
ncbi:MAG: RtcB family protein [Ruminococcaceae bacterium]|nr:RtcB family protein [Oscillospiraceae bacterium]